MRKANELKTICDLLEGYSDENRYDVLEARKNDDGTWELLIKKVELEATEEPKEGADDNQ